MTDKTQKRDIVRPAEISAEVYDDFVTTVRLAFGRDRKALRREAEQAYIDRTEKLKKQYKDVLKEKTSLDN